MGQKKKKNGTHNEYFVLLHLFARLRSQTLGRTCACLRSVINAPVVPRRRWGRVARWDVCGCRRFLAQKNIFWDRSLHLEGKRGGAEDGETCRQAARKRLQASIPKSKGGGLFLFFFFFRATLAGVGPGFLPCFDPMAGTLSAPVLLSRLGETNNSRQG